MVRAREFAFVAGALFLAAAITGFVGQGSSHRSAIVELTLTPAAEVSRLDVPHVLTEGQYRALRSAALMPTPRPRPDELGPQYHREPPQAFSAQDGGHGLAHEVALQLRKTVPANLFAYFDVYLYVSKAASGRWAQHMYIYHRGDAGNLVFEESVPVSTGRERQEKYFTATPTGLFELDPHRFDRHHRSHRWNNAPMPWAMFLNFTIHNRLTGVALHSATGHVAELGHRASGGCVRLPPRTARYLFRRFQKQEAGLVPVFAFDAARGRTRTDGTLEMGPNGKPVMTAGYKVLLVIENRSGRRSYIATLI